MAPLSYTFLPMAAADLPLVREWLEAPHVVEWWGDPEDELALVRDDLGEPSTQQFIVATGNHRFAYLQCYDPTTWPHDHLGALAAGTRGIDQFIGEAGMINRGHGSAFIRAFVGRLFAAGTVCVMTDPDPTNTRAIRAYEKAGFRKDRSVQTPDGPLLLMVRNA
jgi:aminoglycoside 6'-N-acetyltransferase